MAQENEVKAQVAEVLPENTETHAPEVAQAPEASETPTNQVAVVESFKDILKQLLSNPKNRIYKNVRIKNVTKRFSDDVDWENITLIIEGKIPGPVPEGNEFKIGLTSNVYTTSYTIAAVLKQNPRTAMLADMVIKNPEIIPVLLCGSTFNLIQTDVAKNEAYYNPFSNKETRKPRSYEHDWIATNIYDIVLGENGNQVIGGIINHIVGIAMSK